MSRLVLAASAIAGTSIDEDARGVNAGIPRRPRAGLQVVPPVRLAEPALARMHALPGSL